MFWAQHRAVDVPRYCGFQGPAGVRWTIQSLHGQQGPRLNRREENAETLGKRSGEWLVDRFFPLRQGKNIGSWAHQVCQILPKWSVKIWANLWEWSVNGCLRFQFSMENGENYCWPQGVDWKHTDMTHLAKDCQFVSARGFSLHRLRSRDTAGIRACIYIYNICVCVYLWISFIYIASR